MVPATDDVAGVFAPGRGLRRGDSEGRPEAEGAVLTIHTVRPFKGGLLVRFREVGDRAAAEGLQGRTLLIGSDEARPLEDDEYFLHDLVGLEVRGLDGERIGRVVEVYEGGPGHLLGVDDGEREHLIPCTRQIVRRVDLKEGVIVVEPIPGLLGL